MRTLSTFNFRLSTIILATCYLLLATTGCDVLNPPPDIEWENNPYDGRNPNTVPEIISIEFLSKSNANVPARIAINTRGASQIRFSKVNQTGDPLTTSYQSVQSEYQLNLSVGDHIIAAQGKALNGNESAVKYQIIAVEIMYPGLERTFPLGATGQNITMVWIPAGSFLMGRYSGEQDSYSDEDDQHRVTFAQGFWMSKYEITQRQWEAVMGDWDFGFDGNPDNPAEKVSWNDIQNFETALGNAFRLPSEAEWEYACRAGTTTRFYWGDDPSDSQIGTYAWYSSNSGSRTHEVGTAGGGDGHPNAWGLCDMSGNVWEWCEDWYHENYNGAPSDGSAWVSGGGTYRVLRGGSWNGSARGCRSANRNWNLPGVRGSYFYGFRVVRSGS